MSFMRKGFLIYEEMRYYFPIYEEAVIHIWLCNCSILNFLIYEENLIFFFISATGALTIVPAIPLLSLPPNLLPGHPCTLCLAIFQGTHTYTSWPTIHAISQQSLRHSRTYLSHSHPSPLQVSLYFANHACIYNYILHILPVIPLILATHPCVKPAIYPSVYTEPPSSLYIASPLSLLSHPLPLLSHPLPLLSHPFLLLSHPFLLLSHPLPLLSHPVPLLSHPFLLLSHPLPLLSDTYFYLTN